MSKGQDSKKGSKKEPAKTMNEKKTAKMEKIILQQSQNENQEVEIIPE